MSHPRKIPLAAFTLAALMVAAKPSCVTVWAQSASASDEERPFDPDEARETDNLPLNGLRGGFEPGRDENGEDEDRGPRRSNGARNTAGADAGADANGLIGPGGRLLEPLTVQPARRNGEDAADGQEDEQDPYAAIGMHLGSFLLFPELETESVYNDNIFLSPGAPEGDWALEITPGLRARSDWSRHSLEAAVGGVRSYHERFSTEDEKTFTATATGRLDVRRGTNIVTSAGYIRALEDRSSDDFPANAEERAVTRSSDASLEGNHTINRVTLTLRGDLSSEDFDDSRASDGSLINNDDRDYTERHLTGRVAYELQPGVAAFVEASANERDFALAVDDSGTLNGSSGHDMQGGLSFKLTGKLTGEASAGYALQTPDDDTLKDVDGLIFNAGLEWKASGLTTVRLDASSEVAETTQTGSAGSITRAAQVSVEHRPRRHIVLGASLGYEREVFSGVDQKDQEMLVGLTGEYLFTPSIAMTLDYGHLKSWSNQPDNDYNVNEVRLGVRVRR